MFHASGKRRLVATLGVAGSLALAVGAYAYFTSNGSGTGPATVGAASNWTVTVAAATGGPLYPGAGSQSLAYTVTNPSSGHQQLSSTTAEVVATAGGWIKSAGVEVPGCAASGFTAENTSPAAQNLAGGATAAGSVVVTMQDTLTNQNACQSKTPDIMVSAA
jgi:hypothetical protein